MVRTCRGEVVLLVHYGQDHLVVVRYDLVVVLLVHYGLDHLVEVRYDLVVVREVL
jgi:hypothetical protein